MSVLRYNIVIMLADVCDENTILTPETQPPPADCPGPLGREGGNTKRPWEEWGLAFDPFQHLDAGKDSNLPAYLIGHASFERLWGPWPNFFFAPSGGGKTAFRVRLSWACRTQEEGRRFFPITFHLPDPDAVGLPPDENALFSELLRAAGYELLFHLAYRAYEFPAWDQEKRRRLGQALAQTGIPLEHYLEQIEDAGSLYPLVESVAQPQDAVSSSTSASAPDSTRLSPPQDPLPDSLRAFCRSLRAIPAAPVPQRSPLEQFVALWQILIADLGQEAIFVLVDGADAYRFQPQEAISLLGPLLKRVHEWADHKVMFKFFLPDEFHPLVEPNLLTAPSRTVIIEWSREQLADVLRERLRVASRGMFDSFKAMGSPRLARNVEELLAGAADPPVPREVIFLAQQVLAEHGRREKNTHGSLEPEDLDAVLDGYQAGRSRRGQGRAR